MTTGSITSLGLGSTLDLQGILDILRKADESVITKQKAKKTALETTKEEFNGVNAKMLALKSNALSLSLSSTYIGRSLSLSSTDIMSASVVDGTSAGTYSLEVERLASKNSFQSSGKSSASNTVYVPTIQNSSTGLDNIDTAIALADGEDMTIVFGTGDDRQTITITGGTGGTTLEDLATAINNDTDNDDGAGGTYVTATTYQGSDSKYHIKIAATSGGTGEANRVMITDAPAATAFSAPDTSFSYTLGDSSIISLDISSDTTLTELAAQINDDTHNPGVTASIINTGSGDTPYRLVLKSNSTGNDERINIITQLDDLALSEENGSGFSMKSSTLSFSGGPIVIRAVDNNTDFIFQEDTGSGLSADITATIADGVYANGDDLAKAVETALETASSANGSNKDYLVSFNSNTSKIVIEEAGTLKQLKIKWADAGSTAASDLGFSATTTITPGTSSLNASILMDGVEYQRQNNSSINDIITGVTMSIAKVGTTSLTINKVTDKVKDDIVGLVQKLNALIDEIDSNDDYDADTGVWGSLAKYPSISSAKSIVLDVVATKIDNDTDIKSMYDLGFEIKKDGSISLDEETLVSKIASNFDDLKVLFLGDSTTTGLADLINDKLKELTKLNGLMDSEKSSVNDQIDRIDDQIESETERLNKRYDTMTQQFVALDSYMRHMESLQNYITTMIDTNKNQNN